MARRSVAITTGTSVDCRRLAPNSQKDCLLSYIASILQGPSGSAGACWASTPHAKAAYIPLRGGGFYRYMGHYVFMHFAPSFLPSRSRAGGGAVTRIYRSKRDRYGPVPRSALRPSWMLLLPTAALPLWHLWTLRIRLRGLGAEQHALVGTMIDVALQHACTFFPHTVNLTPGSSDCHLANRIDAYTTYWHWPDVAYLSKRDSHTPGPRQSDASPVSKGSASRKQPRPGQCL